MTIKILTDSVGDLPSDVVKELGITVVPLGVRFGTEVYYDKLRCSKTLPCPYFWRLGE